MRAIYRTGRGSFKVRAKWAYNKKDNLIEITEIPYTTTIEAIIDKIAELVKNGDVYKRQVLHVFMPEARKFYNLENLWKDGTPVTLEELGIEDK